MVRETVAKTVGSLGDYLKQQRIDAELTLRQLADRAGVSNPYLSQIERGLRKPSAEVLQQIAKGLRISAEQLYQRAGILDPDVGEAGSVELAVLGDARLTERQKDSLLDIYASFLAVNAPASRGQDAASAGAEPALTESTPTESTQTESTQVEGKK
ncbi:MAG: helix-turn-helix domain-containing protein [Nocardioides sp.]